MTRCRSDDILLAFRSPTCPSAPVHMIDRRPARCGPWKAARVTISGTGFAIDPQPPEVRIRRRPGTRRRRVLAQLADGDRAAGPRRRPTRRSASKARRARRPTSRSARRSRRACTRSTTRRSIATAISSSPSAVRAASRRRSRSTSCAATASREPFVVGHRRTRRRWRSTADGRAVRVQPLRRQRASRRRRTDRASRRSRRDLGVACGIAFGPRRRAVRRRPIGLDPPSQRRTGDAVRDAAAERRRVPSRVRSRRMACTSRRRRSRRATASTACRRDGDVETFCDGFGRPQGLAFDAEGRLYVVDALAGASGAVSRCGPIGRGEPRAAHRRRRAARPRVRSARRPGGRVERHGLPPRRRRPRPVATPASAS